MADFVEEVRIDAGLYVHPLFSGGGGGLEHVGGVQLLQGDVNFDGLDAVEVGCSWAGECSVDNIFEQEASVAEEYGGLLGVVGLGDMQFW